MARSLYSTVDLTAVTGPNIRALTIELPAVCGLNFIGVVNSSLTEKVSQFKDPVGHLCHPDSSY